MRKFRLDYLLFKSTLATLHTTIANLLPIPLIALNANGILLLPSIFVLYIRRICLKSSLDYKIKVVVLIKNENCLMISYHMIYIKSF